jgi:alpha-1,2-mannosyltransferase
MATTPMPRPVPFLRHPWMTIALVAFFTLVAAQYSLKVLNSERDNRSAILRWRQQLLELRDGVDIWQARAYPNPPIMALLLEPIIQLPPMLGSLVFFYLKAGMTLAALVWFFRIVESGGRPFPAWGKVLALLLSLRPIIGDLTHANVNLFILFLVVGGLYAFCRGREVLAGLVLALAVACKVTPALFLPYFLWKRAWRTLAGAAVGLVLFFWLVPGLFLGMERNAQFLANWVENMVLPYARGQVWTDHNNQSLPALAYRMLTDSPSFSTYVDDIYTPTEYHNFVALDKAAIPWLVKGCMAAFAVVVMWSCRTPRGRQRDPERGPARRQGPSEGVGWRLGAEFSIIVLGMLLFSERTWKHHCVTFLLPFTVLAYCLSAHWPRHKRLIIGALSGVFLLMMTTSTGLGDGQERFGKLAQTYGAYVAAYLVMLTALVILLRRGEERNPVSRRNRVSTPQSSSLLPPPRAIQ